MGELRERELYEEQITMIPEFKLPNRRMFPPKRLGLAKPTPCREFKDYTKFLNTTQTHHKDGKDVKISPQQIENTWCTITQKMDGVSGKFSFDRNGDTPTVVKMYLGSEAKPVELSKKAQDHFVTCFPDDVHEAFFELAIPRQLQSVVLNLHDANVSNMFDSATKVYRTLMNKKMLLATSENVIETWIDACSVKSNSDDPVVYPLRLLVFSVVTVVKSADRLHSDDCLHVIAWNKYVQHYREKNKTHDPDDMTQMICTYDPDAMKQWPWNGKSMREIPLVQPVPHIMRSTSKKNDTTNFLKDVETALEKVKKIPCGPNDTKYQIEGIVVMFGFTQTYSDHYDSKHAIKFLHTAKDESDRLCVWYDIRSNLPGNMSRSPYGQDAFRGRRPRIQQPDSDSKSAAGGAMGGAMNRGKGAAKQDNSSNLKKEKKDPIVVIGTYKDKEQTLRFVAVSCKNNKMSYARDVTASDVDGQLFRRLYGHNADIKNKEKTDITGIKNEETFHEYLQGCQGPNKLEIDADVTKNITTIWHKQDWVTVETGPDGKLYMADKDDNTEGAAAGAALPAPAPAPAPAPSAAAPLAPTPHRQPYNLTRRSNAGCNPHAGAPTEKRKATDTNNNPDGDEPATPPAAEAAARGAKRPCPMRRSNASVKEPTVLGTREVLRAFSRLRLQPTYNVAALDTRAGVTTSSDHQCQNPYLVARKQPSIQGAGGVFCPLAPPRDI